MESFSLHRSVCSSLPNQIQTRFNYLPSLLEVHGKITSCLGENLKQNKIVYRDKTKSAGTKVMLQGKQKDFTLLSDFSWQESKTIAGTYVFCSCLTYPNVHHQLQQHTELDETLAVAFHFKG